MPDPLNRSHTKSDSQERRLIDLLMAKYRADPEGLRECLPEVAQALDAMEALVPERSAFGLTEREREHRSKALLEVLERLRRGTISSQEAVKGLEHTAVLVEDGALPLEVDHDTMLTLVRAAVGKSPGSIKKITTISVQDGQEGKIVSRVSVLRGVELDLTWDMRLVSVTISPRKVQQRRKLLRFVGSAEDPATDVAEQHDRYLAQGSPHGGR